MGTSHNRWYVERLFARLAGPTLDTTLARRLAIEFRADAQRVKRAIAHMEWSVNISSESLHPELQASLT